MTVFTPEKESQEFHTLWACLSVVVVLCLT
jgi:hypothetical protein